MPSPWCRRRPPRRVVWRPASARPWANRASRAPGGYRGPVRSPIASARGRLRRLVRAEERPAQARTRRGATIAGSPVFGLGDLRGKAGSRGQTACSRGQPRPVGAGSRSTLGWPGTTGGELGQRWRRRRRAWLERRLALRDPSQGMVGDFAPLGFSSRYFLERGDRLGKSEPLLEISLTEHVSRRRRRRGHWPTDPAASLPSDSAALSACPSLPIRQAEVVRRSLRHGGASACRRPGSRSRSRWRRLGWFRPSVALAGDQVGVGVERAVRVGLRKRTGEFPRALGVVLGVEGERRGSKLGVVGPRAFRLGAGDGHEPGAGVDRLAQDAQSRLQRHGNRSAGGRRRRRRRGGLSAASSTVRASAGWFPARRSVVPSDIARGDRERRLAGRRPSGRSKRLGVRSTARACSEPRRGRARLFGEEWAPRARLFERLERIDRFLPVPRTRFDLTDLEPRLVEPLGAAGGDQLAEHVLRARRRLPLCGKDSPQPEPGAAPERPFEVAGSRAFSYDLTGGGEVARLQRRCRPRSEPGRRQVADASLPPPSPVYASRFSLRFEEVAENIGRLADPVAGHGARSGDPAQP